MSLPHPNGLSINSVTTSVMYAENVFMSNTDLHSPAARAASVNRSTMPCHPRMPCLTCVVDVCMAGGGWYEVVVAVVVVVCGVWWWGRG